MWYGVLGTKELVQKTYKNLEQRVQLEVRACVGQTGRKGMHDVNMRTEYISPFSDL